MMKISAFALAAALALAPFAAFAQSAGGGTPAGTSVSTAPAAAAGSLSAVTATTTSASLVAANASRRYFFVSNEAAAGGGTIAACPTSVSTPAINAAGCKTLYPGQFWAACSGSFCPSDAFNIIGSASTPVLFGQN